MRGTWIKVLGILLVMAAGVSAQRISNVYLDAHDQYNALFGPNFYSNFSGNFLGSGARSRGMGSAFMAVSDDITAVTWNPAGLLGFEKAVFGVSYSGTRPRGSYDDFGPLVLNNMTSLNAKQAGSLSNLEYLSFLSPMRIRGHQFVFSGAYSRQFEDYSVTNTDFYALLPYYTETDVFWDFTYGAHVTGKVEQHATPYAVNIGFGTRLRGNLNVGFALNVYSGKQYNRTSELIHVPLYYALNLLGGQPVVRDEYITLLDTFSFSGVNFTLGAKGTAGKLSYGAVVRSGYDLKLQGGVTFIDSVMYNGKAQPDLSYTIYDVDKMLKMSIPWTFAVGGAYKATDNLLLAADVEYRPYSGKEVSRRDSTKIRSGQDNEEFFTSIDPGWFNCFGFRSGLEYSWHTGKTVAPIVPLRCGVGYMTVPAPSYQRPVGQSDVSQDSLLAQVTTESTAQFSLSAGTGVHWSQIHLDLAYSYTSLSRDQVTFMYMHPYILPAASYGGLSTRNHNFTLSFTGYF